MLSPYRLLDRIGAVGPLCRAAAILVAVLVLTLPAGVPAAAGPARQGHEHDHPPAERAPTAVERDAANALVAATRAGTARLGDPAVALAEGYLQGTAYAFYGLRAAHFYHLAYSQDGVYLDPARPENVMYLKHDDGSLELIGVMFTAPAGAGPQVGGPLTLWHTHPDLCSGLEGLVLKHADGTCPPQTVSVDFEMLHVWLIDVPGGPFADNPVGELPGPLVGAGHPHNSLVAGTGLVDSAAMLSEIGDLLGLTPVAIGRRYEAGESLAEMAAGSGVTRAALVDLMSEWLTAEFDRAVARGDMTEGQRELTLASLSPLVERMVEIHAGEPWLTESAA